MEPMAAGSPRRKDEKMKTILSALLIGLLMLAAFAAPPPNFSATWVFNREKSKNLGMMPPMKMTQTIEQSASSFDVTLDTTFLGNHHQTKTHYDLSGKTVQNDSAMAGPSDTVSQWQGDKLVTTWTGKNDPKSVRTETRWLSPDGKTMTVESVRGANPPAVMVFDRQ